MKIDYLAKLRKGEDLTFRQEIAMIWQLSVPAILAQISSIIMQYIDASMVGQLGAGDSASIGLISTSTWLFGGLCSAAAAGFTVQVAHRIGAGDELGARGLVRHGLFLTMLYALGLMAIAMLISVPLPTWLGGAPVIRCEASKYFFIYAMMLPLMEINHTAGGMLQCSGNMKVPSILNILMCVMDVLFNYLFIFVLHMGVTGAALGTLAAEAVGCLLMLYFLLVKSESLHLRKEKVNRLSKQELKTALRISLPVAFESTITGGAYVAMTLIVAPLGTIAIAANSFSITAESLCYMPGYGIGAAATTLIGQTYGAKRMKLAKRLGWLTTLLGMAVMTVMGVLMFFLAPVMIGVLTPVPAVRSLGTEILRIEAFAEPLYAASIVASGVLRGAGNTLTSSILNLISMWCVRLPLAAMLAPVYGLKGVWIAMALELCVRGFLFLIKLLRSKF